MAAIGVSRKDAVGFADAVEGRFPAHLSCRGLKGRGQNLGVGKMKKCQAVLALCGVVLTACTGHLERSPYRFYMPKDYVGWVQVEFKVSGAPPLPIEDGYRVVRFPAGGILRTSSAMEEGWAKDEYFEYAGNEFTKLSDGYQTGVVNAGSTGVAGSVHFWRFFVGPYSDYMKFGNPNTTNPVIGPIAPGQ